MYRVLKVSSAMRFGFPIPSKTEQTVPFAWAVIPEGDLPNSLIENEETLSKEVQVPTQHAPDLDATWGHRHVQPVVLGAAG